MIIANKKFMVSAVIIATTAILLWVINTTSPETQREKPTDKALINVEVQTLKLQEYAVKVESFGVVRPRVQSLLVSQAAGQITFVDESFREGGFFKKGDVLLTLDDRDNKALVKSAKASVLVAEQNLQEEQARGKQAATDWERLGNGEKASNLVLREPQLAAAKAQLLSAQAQLDQAKLDLERTKIIAPYDGRILSRSVDLGQVVTSNMQLAEIYATDSVEVRLPIKNKDLPFIDLPENYRDAVKNPDGTKVDFYSDLIGEQHWQGKIVRTESAIDSAAQQLYVVAQINDPYKATQENQYPVKIGQYVTATIYGKKVAKALVIPNFSIYQGSYVYIVEGGLLKRKNIELAWQNADKAIVKEGLSEGQQLVLTALGQVNSGTRANTVNGNKKNVKRVKP